MRCAASFRNLEKKILRPTLLLDETTARENIRSMADKAHKNNIFFRPHFKTHRSARIGEWFRDEGIRAITVSSLRMAEYFAHHGWNDITVAFPVNIREKTLIRELSERITLNLLASSPQTIEALEQELSSPAGIFVEIDTGYRRSGVSYTDTATLEKIINVLGRCRKLHFRGLISHTGDTYHASGTAEILGKHRTALNRMRQVQQRFLIRFDPVLISMGDTPAFSLLEEIRGIDEMRPGNFVFYDLMQWQLGACRPEQIAVALACPVTEIHPERNEAILYGGAVHFSRERLAAETFSHYGLGVDITSGHPLTELFIKALSQEHGILHLPGRISAKVRPGDLLLFYPVHSCLTANLMGRYLTCRGEWIESSRSI